MNNKCGDYAVVYFGTIFIASFFAWLAQKFAKDKESKFKLNKIFWSLSILTLIITMGFRSIGVGIDDYAYNRIFNNVITHGPITEFLQTTMEPGYLILNYIIGLFTKDFQAVLLITSCIPIMLYYKAIEYERKNVNLFLAVFLFGALMYLYFFGIIRLFIAASIVTYALRFVFEKKNIKYVFFVLLATSFHYSAIFMLFLLYFSMEKEENPRKISSIILLVVVAMPIIIIVVSQVIFPSMGDRYQGYTTINSFKLSIDQFDKLPITLLALFLYKDLVKLNKNAKIYITLCALTTVISIYSTVVAIGRIQWYLNFSICILLPLSVRAINKNKLYKFWNILFVPIIICYGILYSYQTITIQESNQRMPDYSNVLFNKN